MDEQTMPVEETSAQVENMINVDPNAEERDLIQSQDSQDPEDVAPIEEVGE